MSYDIYLLDPKTGKTIEVDKPHQLKGGIYALGGTMEAWLDVTYNYGKHYYRYFGEKGIRTIYGMTGEESIPLLQQVADKLEDDVTDNYWDPTEGNAKRALLDLIDLARLAPHGIWDGD